MTTTEQQIARLTADWSKIAGEKLKVERIGGAFYGFCSELGALRLFYKYRYSVDKAKVLYSDNQGTWVFRLETNL